MFVSYDTAAMHLKLYDLKMNPEVEADVRLKLAQAEALVLTHIKTPDPGWTDETDPATNFLFAVAQAATLLILSNLWRFRGDDETKGENGPLTPRVAELLSQFRDPSLA
jgi:hypothetical protein